MNTLRLLAKAVFIWTLLKRLLLLFDRMTLAFMAVKDDQTACNQYVLFNNAGIKRPVLHLEIPTLLCIAFHLKL